jgi:UDP-N-acetylmuramate--alanine ligase
MVNPKILKFQHFHLVGIKGVAMTSLAQILNEAGKTVTGTDVEEEFVTQDLLEKTNARVNFDFRVPLPPETECVVYTSAHGGPQNPQVVAAKAADLPTYSQAEALAEFFNSQRGVAVCGVGGKTTTSAMIAFVLQKYAQQNQQAIPSFSVGVGNIPGLNKTGQWNPESETFVAEADEYVIDPAAQPITPRFSFLKPWLTICTNLKYDHPDVYPSLEATIDTYQKFFTQIKEGGFLLLNNDDPNLKKIDLDKIKAQILTYGSKENSDCQLLNYSTLPGESITDFRIGDLPEQTFTLKMQVPGKYNVYNALAAILALKQLGIDPQQSANILRNFKGTQRRFELIGNKNGVTYYDDYAHHPDEVKSAIQALKEWYPDQKKIVIFQSHTYSRTKKLFDKFITSFADADQVLMIDIFSSAREKDDPTVSSDLLCQEISKKYPNLEAKNLHDLDQLATYLKTNTQPGNVVITLGAGDVYKVHNMIS